MPEIEKLKQMVSGAKRLVAFTGAGISAESGIPTYRGDNGVWHKYNPTIYANIEYFLEDSTYYWNFFKDVRYPALKHARPNKAHSVLAGLEESGILSAVITQNIDGLHQMAGSRRVLELHGNTRRISCLDCKRLYTMDEVYHQIQTQLPPPCSKCGGYLKPEVVFFGEQLPPGVMNASVEEVRKCDLFLVVGSSLVVQPAASLPVMARESGVSIVIINKDPTPLDSIADLVFHRAASEILEQIV